MLAVACYFAGPLSAMEDDWDPVDQVVKNIYNAAGKIPFDQTIFENILTKLHTTVNAQSADGFTALHFAVLMNEQNIVQNLLAQPTINRELSNAWGDTPLISAVKAENPTMVDLLIAGPSGANVNATNPLLLARTPLHYAARQYATVNGWKSIQIIESLLNADANINSQDLAGYTPLHYAAQVGNVAICDLLIMRGADKNIKGFDTTTPFDLAKATLQTLLTNTSPDATFININAPLSDQITLGQLKSNLKEVIEFLAPPVLPDQSDQPDDQPNAQPDDQPNTQPNQPDAQPENQPIVQPTNIPPPAPAGLLAKIMAAGTYGANYFSSFLNDIRNLIYFFFHR